MARSKPNAKQTEELTSRLFHQLLPPPACRRDHPGSAQLQQRRPLSGAQGSCPGPWPHEQCRPLRARALGLHPLPRAQADILELSVRVLISGALSPQGSAGDAGAGPQAGGRGPVRSPRRTPSEARLPPALTVTLRQSVSKPHLLTAFNILPRIHTQHWMETFRVVKCI